VLAGAAVALVALVPLLYVAYYTLTTSPSEARHLLFRQRMGELLWNSVRLIAVGITLSALLGVGAAWLIERTDLPLRRLWHALMCAPLAVPAFVNGYAWVSLTHSVEGFWGASLIVTLSYFPLVYLPVSAMLRGLDPALEEVAQSLGYGGLKRFVHVVLPVLRPALLGGCVLVGLHLLAEFGALQMLRYNTFTTAIYDQYESSFNGTAANMLASVLVLLCLVLLVGELKLRGHRRLARVGSGAARKVPPVHLGRLAAPVVLGLGGLTALSLGVPIGSLVHWLRAGSSTAFPVDRLVSTTATTVGLSIAAGALTVVLAAPVAWLAVRRPGLLSTIFERCTYVANALPGIVVALALVTVSIRSVQPLYRSYALLVLAYAIMFLPLAMVSVRSALELAPPVLEDVAASLGLSKPRIVARVTFPLVLPGVGAGAALVFLAVATELTATLLLSPIGTRTLATEFWANSSSVAYGAAAPYALLLILISIPASLLLSRQASAVVTT
jgi:iron(III) transport system permease protein